jgi:hypothetical protein
MEKFLNCICHSPSHIIKLQIYNWQKNNISSDIDLSVSVHISPEQSIFKRIWIAIKYIFGHQSEFGEFAEILLDESKTKEIKEFLDFYLDSKEKLRKEI